MNKVLRASIYFSNPKLWLQAVKNPFYAGKTITNVIKHPNLFIKTRNVEGLIHFSLGVVLYEAALKTKYRSGDIVEVGAFKGLSTIYLADSAKHINKRVKSFELFSGLPTADRCLDPSFEKGQYSSDQKEYDNNLRTSGVRNVVDLVIGDARETMLPSIRDSGFALCFLDVDVYEVMKDLLFQLWILAKGGEVVFCHDSDSPGVNKAIGELLVLSHNSVKETEYRFQSSRTMKLVFPISIK